MKHAQRILAALLACGASLSALAAVTATLDRDHLAAGETVRLLLQRDGSADGQPDLAPLKRDFVVLGSSRGSRVQIVNGHASSQSEVSLLLAPRHDGKIRVPPLQWGSEQSPELELTVGGGGTAGPAASKAESRHVFLSATLDRSPAYVQAAVVLTVKLYADQPLYDASMELPASADVLVKQVGEDKQSSETRNGQSYRVVERRYLLFPQRSGQIRLDGPALDAKVPAAQDDDPFGGDSLFGNVFGHLRLPGMMTATRPLHVYAKPIELDVLPRPAGATGSHWLPAQDVTLEESWRPDNASLHAGEPLTRHLRLDALGLTGAQLPDLDTLMQVPDGIKPYPDQARVEDKPQGATILGSREQDIALIAQQAGHYVLPAVHLSWWDTVHRVQREAVLPSRTLDVLPAAAGAPVTPMVQPARPAPSISPQPGLLPSLAANARLPRESPWPWISLALATLWLATLLAWWRSRRAPQATPRAKADQAAPATVPAGNALRAFRQACRDNEARAARRHLLEWSRSTWPDDPPPGLNALSRRMEDASLAELLQQLDRACYTNAAWQGEALAKSFPNAPPRKTAARPEQVLPELYP